MIGSPDLALNPDQCMTVRVAILKGRDLYLKNYNAEFDRGASRVFEGLWLLIGLPLVSSAIIGSCWRKALLRAFGASIGKSVVLKQRIIVKFPWRLSIGNYSWIGEGVWIDNLAFVEIGSNVCISQGAYLCTGNHDYRSQAFDLFVRPISIEDHAWVGAFAKLSPGTRIAKGAILTLGSVSQGHLVEWTVYQGVPGMPVRKRSIECS